LAVNVVEVVYRDQNILMHSFDLILLGFRF